MFLWNRLKKKQISSDKDESGETGSILYGSHALQMDCKFAGISKKEEFCCLEPSIRDGEAIITITGRRQHENCHIFGVDLNEKTAEEAMRNELIEDCLYGNFLTDVIISKETFSFCFANPPYGEQEKMRHEVMFLSKIIPYLKEDAVLVFVLPQYVASTEKFLGIWTKQMDTECYYRFHDAEYEKWKQIVLIGRLKKDKQNPEEDKQKLHRALSVKEVISLLPESYSGKKIIVNPSSEKEITEYTTRIFNAKKAK